LRSCVRRVEQALENTAGVISATVNLATGRATITYAPYETSASQIIQTIKDTGYEAEEVGRPRARKRQDKMETRREEETKSHFARFLFSAIFSLPLISLMLSHLFGVNLPTWLESPHFQFVMATPVQFGAGWQFYRGRFRIARQNSHMDTLIAIGTTAAYAFSVYHTFISPGHVYYESSAVIITLVLLAVTVEAHAKGKTGEA